ncbi:hypothetical protein [Paraburkholderia heleia]|uniref:hypothetical protein n=1 Tax=Paraburkholderia heleia TaxID=634127 RepID=UPI001427DC78|nr:hypothetical protein [Paraburkholderia heleia]
MADVDAVMHITGALRGEVGADLEIARKHGVRKTGFLVLVHDFAPGHCGGAWHNRDSVPEAGLVRRAITEHIRFRHASSIGFGPSGNNQPWLRLMCDLCTACQKWLTRERMKCRCGLPHRRRSTDGMCEGQRRDEGAIRHLMQISRRGALRATLAWTVRFGPVQWRRR